MTLFNDDLVCCLKILNNFQFFLNHKMPKMLSVIIELSKWLYELESTSYEQGNFPSTTPQVTDVVGGIQILFFGPFSLLYVTKTCLEGKYVPRADESIMRAIMRAITRGVTRGIRQIRGALFGPNQTPSSAQCWASVANFTPHSKFESMDTWGIRVLAQETTISERLAASVA